MIIVSGRIYLHPGRRDHFLAASLQAVKLARQAKGCLDFLVAADPIGSNRVNVYEAWGSVEALGAFRQQGLSADEAAQIVRFEVQRHEVAWSGPP